MLISIAILLLVTIGGAILTYLYDSEDPLLIRLCAGNVIGSVIFGFFAFILACFFYLQVWVAAVSLAMTLLPLLLLFRTDIWKNFLRDWRKAEGKLEGTTSKKVWNLVYYTGIFIMLYLFFDRAMIEAKDGIYTGAANNLGDLHFHLDAIYSFVFGQNFPPENPSYAGTKFSYPFIADMISAAMVTLGASARRAMFWQNLFLGFSLVVLMETFTLKITRSKAAGKIAPLLLLFSGGLGFVLFLRDYWNGSQDIFKFLWSLHEDYTIRFSGGLRWGNSLTSLFITQRSLLLGMPLTLIVLTYLWKIFTASEQDEERGTAPKIFASFLAGFLAGQLPLVHLHSLAVLFLVSGFLAILTPKQWKNWLAFLAGTALIGVPELVWAMTGSATKASAFIDWNFGWDSGDWNVAMFWLINTGLLIPLLLTAIVLMVRGLYAKDEKTRPFYAGDTQKLLLFYIPFALCFIISNVVKLAPWQWDNIKVLIYWFVGSIPLVALLLVNIWKLGKWPKFLTAGFFAVLIFAGALDVWRVITAKNADAFMVANADAIKIADDIKNLTQPRALFLNAPIYNSPVGLSGRRSLMRYTGHLSSYGIDYSEREADEKKIYAGLATADMLMRKYDIEYVLIGPEEQRDMKANEQFFSRYPVIAEEGEYRVFKIK